MLDSTGVHDTKKVPCFVCEGNDLQFPTYTPRVGHDGRDLKVGTCIEQHVFREHQFKNWKGAKFFEIKPVPKDSWELYEWVCFAEVTLQRSPEPYHYNGLVLPDFGDRVGKTVYVCPSCVTGYDGVSLQDFDLQRAFNRTMNKFGEKVLLRMIIDGRLWKFLPEMAKKMTGLARKDLRKNLEELMRNLRASNPKRARFGLRRYGPIEKVLR